MAEDKIKRDLVPTEPKHHRPMDKSVADIRREIYMAKVGAVLVKAINDLGVKSTEEVGKDLDAAIEDLQKTKPF